MVAARAFHELPEFKRGRKVEDAIAQYCWRSLGYIIVQLGRIEDVNGGGPRLDVPTGDSASVYPKRLIVPDLLCMQLAGWRNLSFDLPDEFFVDVKSKARASWFRANKAWQSGIDRRVWKQYQEVGVLTRKPVWVFHLIEQATQDQMDQQGAPQDARPNPTGLYAHSVLQPIAPNPFDPNGTSKLVYWKIKDMIKLATLEEVMEPVTSSDDLDLEGHTF